MHISAFDFDLPEALIATRPAVPRSAARLAVAQGDRITDARVSDMPHWLQPGDRLILNDTKVIPARLDGIRRRMSAQGATQARIATTLLAPQADGSWAALLRPLKKVRPGEVLTFSAGLSAQLEKVEAGQARLRFNLSGVAFEHALDTAGAMPLPPYIATRRPADARDRTDYQSVWARVPGAVAAPTASLHFDAALLAALGARGVALSYVTLHVGAGTFLPVQVEDVTRHKMHGEWGRVSATAAQEIAATKAAGGRIVAVGTTALRLIETAAARGGAIAPWEGVSDIFIYPGFRFHVADGLVTNFHLPRSTLIMLVCAFLGTERIAQLYAHAIATRYRFFSYGDASLLWREKPNGIKP